MLLNLLRQFLRDKSLLFWIALAGLLITTSVFMAGTLLTEQKTAAFVYGRFALHWQVIIGLIAWGSAYFARLRQSGEMLFWLTLPISRLRLLGVFVLAFNVLAICMIAFSTLLLWIFTAPSFGSLLQFMLTSGFEAIVCATLIVLFCFSLDGTLKAPFAVIVVLLLGHLVPSFDRSLDTPFLLKDNSLQGSLMKGLSGLIFISPRFESLLTLTSVLQTTGFMLLIGVLCHIEFSRKKH